VHLPTHILSGWCAANLLKLTPRQRGFCILAATLPDLDGLSILAGWDAFYTWHHHLTHGLPFAILLAGILTAFSTRPVLSFLLYLALVHLHLLMDSFGSGIGWTITYLWPFSDMQLDNPWSWEFSTWRNQLAGLLFIAWTVGIAVIRRRTPLEVPMPNLDRQLVDWLRRRFGLPPVFAKDATDIPSTSGNSPINNP
jgi:hypothetical protein